MLESRGCELVGLQNRWQAHASTCSIAIVTFTNARCHVLTAIIERSQSRVLERDLGRDPTMAQEENAGWFSRSTLVHTPFAKSSYRKYICSIFMPLLPCLDRIKNVGEASGNETGASLIQCNAE